MIDPLETINESNDVQSESEAKKRLVYGGASISLLALAFHVYININVDQWLPVYISGIPISILIIGVLFNRAGSYVLGTMSVILGFCIYFPYQHYIYGDNLGMTPVFLVMLVFSIVVLEGHKLPLIICICSIIVSYGLSRYMAEHYDTTLNLIRSDAIADIYFINCCLLCLLLLLSVLKLKRSYLNLTKNLLIDVNRKNEILKLQNEELENFAFATSHDLKTPLRNINSFVGLIENKLSGTDDPKLKEYIGIVKNGSTQMSAIIDNILSLSSIDKDSKIETFSLTELLDGLMFNYTDPINSGKVKIEYRNLPYMRGLKKEMSDLMMNLIDNAIKYNQNDTAIIQIKSEQSDNAIKIIVSDNGIGIDPEFHELIFKPFKRLHSDHEYKGTGLGLAIVKKVVDSHNGSIQLNSDSSGSTFSITIPNLA